MRLAALAFAGFATFIAFPESAQAQKECPRGWSWNGRVCAPYAEPGQHDGKRYSRPPRRGRGGIINCGPGMNSDGYRCFPIWQRHEYRRYRR
jgi:hypothetical protein